MGMELGPDTSENLHILMRQSDWEYFIDLTMYSRPHIPTNIAGSIPDGVTGIFHWYIILRSHYGRGVDSASNRNEYQEHFLGVMAAGA